MSQIIYTNDEMAYDENNQQITHMQPASPMTQETTTIHYVPSRNVSNWEMTSASFPERWDDNGYAFYYNTSPSRQQQPSSYYLDGSNGDYSYYNGSYENQMNLSQYRSYPKVEYESEWEQPRPVIVNRRNNEAMKQFMQRNSGGGCTVMQPAQRERVATPRSDYPQRFHPHFMEYPPEFQRGSCHQLYSPEYVTEQPYVTMNIPEGNASVSYEIVQQQPYEAATLENNFTTCESNPVIVTPTDLVQNQSTSQIHESQTSANKEVDNDKYDREKSVLEKQWRTSADERHEIVNKILELENEVAKASNTNDNKD